MLQKKVFQMENDLYETSVEDEEILDRMSPDPNINVFGNEKKREYKASVEHNSYQGKAKEEGPRYYYVLHGKYDHKTTSFFRGYVADHQEYEQQQSGTWKFIGNSSRDCEKLTKWIIQNQDIVDKENKTFHNPDCSVRNGTVLSVSRNQYGLGRIWFVSTNSKPTSQSWLLPSQRCMRITPQPEPMSWNADVF